MPPRRGRGRGRGRGLEREATSVPVELSLSPPPSVHETASSSHAPPAPQPQQPETAVPPPTPQHPPPEIMQLFVQIWQMMQAQISARPPDVSAAVPPPPPVISERLEVERGKVRENEFSKKRKFGASSSQPPRRNRGTISIGGPTRPTISLPSHTFQPPRASATAAGSESTVRSTSSHRCPRCLRFHTGLCRETRACFHCGWIGHIRANCPELTPAGTSTQPLSSRRSCPIRPRPPAPSPAAPDTRSRSGTGSVIPAASRPQTRAQTQAYSRTREDAQANPEVITGTVLLLTSILMLKLILSRSGHMLVPRLLSMLIEIVNCLL